MTKLESGYALSVVRESEDGDWEVWINPDWRDGLCLGVGKTRDAAVAQAVATLEEAATRLQEPVLEAVQ